MREKITTCALFAWKDSVFGPTFLRPDDHSTATVQPTTEDELALVFAFLSLAEAGQFELTDLTPLGTFYHGVKMQEARTRQALFFQESNERDELTKQMRLNFRGVFDDYTSSCHPILFQKKTRVEPTLESLEIQERSAVLQEEEKASVSLNKQKKLFNRLFDPKKETEAPVAKKLRPELAQP